MRKAIGDWSYISVHFIVDIYDPRPLKWQRKEKEINMNLSTAHTSSQDDLLLLCFAMGPKSFKVSLLDLDG